MKFKLLIALVAVTFASCDSPTDSLPVISAVEIIPASNSLFGIQLETREALQLHARVTFADGDTATNASVTWITTDMAVATVDANGLLQAAPSYGACSVFSGTPPYGCYLSVVATAGGKADTAAVFVSPTIVIEDTPSITLAAGDSTTLPSPVAKVDGVVRCTFFLGPVWPAEVIRRSASYFVAVAPGEGHVEWSSADNLCRGKYYQTLVQVVPRNP